MQLLSFNFEGEYETSDTNMLDVLRNAPRAIPKDGTEHTSDVVVSSDDPASLGLVLALDSSSYGEESFRIKGSLASGVRRMGSSSSRALFDHTTRIQREDSWALSSPSSLPATTEASRLLSPAPYISHPASRLL